MSLDSVCVCVLVFQSHMVVVLCPAALIFEGSVNPAHPKHIGSIDPSCDVAEVVKGNKHTHILTRCVIHFPPLFVCLYRFMTCS